MFEQYENVSFIAFLIFAVIALGKLYLDEKKFSRDLSHKVIKLATLWEEKADKLSNEYKGDLTSIKNELSELNRRN